MNPKWNGQFSCFDLVAKTDAHSRSVVQVRDIEIGGTTTKVDLKQEQTTVVATSDTSPIKK